MEINLPIDEQAILAMADTTDSTQRQQQTSQDDTASQELTGVVEIPEPEGLPWVGHIRNVDPEVPLRSFTGLADQYGEIYRLRFFKRTIVFVSTQALVNELCDEKRFQKCIDGALTHIRNGVHDGLFTARKDEENWGIAHRVLMPAFGPLSIRGMFDEMHDIASQLALKWARCGSGYEINVTDDFTRLTLDTLALCSMGYRFNSYYSPVLHPFIDAMGDFLTAAGGRNRRPLPQMFYRAEDQKFDADIETLRSTAREVLDARKAGLSDRDNDLLAAMLKGVDTKTGKKMTDESIMDNLITFLIAGHETTSGLLSFTFYQLCKHPEAYAKAQAEVDAVVGKGPITVDHLSRLPYINGVLRETLRVNATIPIFAVEPLEDTLLAGKYPVKKGETLLNLLAKSQLDPKVFGSDATEFKPERMMDDNFNRLNREFPNCWKPFGNGMRGCIGRPFAWQEALLVVVMLLQNFNFVLRPGYDLAIKQTLTIKPGGMTMRAILRDNLTATTLERRLNGTAAAAGSDAKHGAASHAPSEDGSAATPLTILYGSNSGTCEALAQRVATDAAGHGFRAKHIDCLDTANQNLPKGEPVVIITASYEGLPPDNAGLFISWIDNLAKKDDAAEQLKGVDYTVFGCGHRDWVQTYHRIPKHVDATLDQLGADRIAKIGLTDVSSGDAFTEFETWEDTVLWPALKEKYGSQERDSANGSGDATNGGTGAKSTGGVKVVVSNPRKSTLRQDVQEAVVTETRTLTSPEEKDVVKKHVAVKLPEGMKYAAGDYLAVLPINPKETVQRAMRLLRLPWDAYVTITTDGPSTLPVDSAIPANEVLSSYLELAQPATKRSINMLIENSTEEAVKDELTRLSNEGYTEEIKNKRVSVLDLLERYASIQLPVGTFFSMMPPMRVRQYSISSSPLNDPSTATVSFSVLRAPSLSGHGLHIGVATSYLDSVREGDTVHVTVRPSHAAFSLPVDPEDTPLVCIAAGAGLAPFRGFIQERARMIASGRKNLAPALLFFGCRSPDRDDLYREELDEWQKLGAVDVRRAYSRKPEESEGCKYVQDRMLKDREDLLEVWQKGAKVFVCGSSRVGEAVKEAILKMRKESGQGSDDDEKDREWFEGQRNIRYVTDIFD